jgi:NAD(P)-dependent dehydrogenase (short-subunit alcohol dehydrogenase family)
MSALTGESTTDDAIGGRDLSGKSYLVTGASSGLGEETTRALAAHGGSVIMAARNPDKLQLAAERIRSAHPDAQLEVRVIDLADQGSIRDFAAALLADHDTIDVVINNAGVMVCPFGLTSDGLEMQFGTNHVGHFLLSTLLLDRVSDRVVTLSSGAHLIADIDLEDPDYAEGEYDPWEAYGRSKSANALFALELAKREAGRGLQSYSVHPGLVATELARHLTDELLIQMTERLSARDRASGGDGKMPSLRGPDIGAATQVWAATTDDLVANNGSYLQDCRLASDSEKAPWITDEDSATVLWEFTENLVAGSAA